MWRYEKRLQYPIHIKTPNAKIAQIIMSQYGGPYRSNLCIKKDYKNSLFFCFCRHCINSSIVQFNAIESLCTVSTAALQRNMF